MDGVRNSPVSVPRVTNRCEVQHFPEDKLQRELQHFWSQEILHLQSEPQHRLASSLEKQFLYDDYLTNPIPPEERRRKKIFRHHKSEQSRVVRGEDLNDVPTTYLISGLEPHEIPVIGTYVDKSILPGFRYKVRLNQTKKYHFGGRALRLLSVGPGYGKRLSFEGKSSLKNLNYFWSDNHPEGYGFALEVVSEGDKFSLRCPANGLVKGVVEILRFSKHQRDLQTTVCEDGSVVKTVQLDFWCRYIDEEHKEDFQIAEFRLEGVATVVKPKGPSSVARVQSITVRKNTHQEFEMLPMQF